MPRDRMAHGGLDSRPVADTATSGDRRTDCMSTMPIATAPRPWRFASRNLSLRADSTPRPRPTFQTRTRPDRPGRAKENHE